MKTDLVEGTVEKVSREEVVKALGKMKAGKAAGPSEVSVEICVIAIAFCDCGWRDFGKCEKWFDE